MNEVTHKYCRTDERKQAIAEAASALIVQKGIDALRTREVAAEVGINIATLHYHVPSKDALIHLVIDGLREAFCEQQLARGATSGSALERLELQIAGFKDTMVNRPELLQLIDEMNKRGRVDPQVDEKMREMKIRWHCEFVDILTAGRAEGIFRDNMDPVAAAHMITGALVSFQYKPRRLLSLFDSVAKEIIQSVTRVSS